MKVYKKFGKKLLQLFIYSILTVLNCTPSEPVSPNQRFTVSITAHIGGPKYDGTYYTSSLPATDFVFWVENSHGDYIKTIKISKGAVNVAKSGIHANHLPTWQNSTGVISSLKVSHDSLSYILPQFDGLTSASLKLNNNKDTIVSAIWDFTDGVGVPVDEGTYYLCVECANIRKYGVFPAISEVQIVSEITKASVDTRTSTLKSGNQTSNISSCFLSLESVQYQQDTDVDGVSSASKK